MIGAVGPRSAQVLDVDVPGNATFEIGAEVGVRFPEPAGVLVPVAS